MLKLSLEEFAGRKIVGTNVFALGFGRICLLCLVEPWLLNDILLLFITASILGVSLPYPPVSVMTGGGCLTSPRPTPGMKGSILVSTELYYLLISNKL